MNRIRRGTVLAFVLLGISIAGSGARAQSAIDTMRLAIVPPDSVYVRREGSTILVRWYPPAEDVASISGSRDFSNWYLNDPAVSRVGVTGIYRGAFDRTIKISRIVGTATRDTVAYTPSIRMLAEVVDRFDSYAQEFNLGSLYYTAGSAIPLVLTGQETDAELDLGISLSFSDGVVDTTWDAAPAYFEIDLQTYEGFHVWRGLSPVPSHMEIISELSRDDAYLLGERADSLYFLEWPKNDEGGRPYYEIVDEDVFVGFTYYYHVSCFDKGYFKGKFLFNKLDNFICDEDPEAPEVPGEPVECEEVAHKVVMTVDAPESVDRIYAVPNPYRTGTSAATSSYYHNFPDGTIKFFNIPGGADIRIFTVSGDLVWEHRHLSADGDDGVVSWDVKNKEGGDVCSGVYIYRVEAAGGEDMYGRLVVIR